jgi:hypothetical protein
MMPEAETYERYARYFRGEDNSELSPAQNDAVQTWLVEAGYDEDEGNWDEKLCYYCRHMHSEWGVQWTDKYLSGKAELYNGWVEDIKKLCRSHHQEYQDLIEKSFDPDIKHGNTIHFRYLAAVLRVADVLEFDPERTPRVLFRHRQIDEKSRIFWLKDHEVDLIIQLPSNATAAKSRAARRERIARAGSAPGLDDTLRVIIKAHPTSAVNHRAIEMMINDVDAELQLCRNLDLARSFASSSIGQLPHRWVLPNFVQRDFRPQERDGRPNYEYIDGAFRPDTAKLLELLAGTELYGDWRAGVRELLSNAFDAVRERIARRRLELSDPLNPTGVSFLEREHFVSLRLEASEGRCFLVCEDNGVGMDKAVIRDYLLVSGKSRRPDLATLERDCRGRGFSFDRTGKFGVGVLSYFMLADKVIIRTRRYAGEYCEPHGWRFETDGVGSFGELRRDDDIGGGTEVTLRVKQEIYGRQLDKMVEQHLPDDAAGRQWTRENWSKMMLAKQISEYLKATVVRVPCAFEFRCMDLKELEIAGGPGWMRSEQELRELLEQKGRELLEQVSAGATIGLEWRTGKLPEDAGEYRLGLPYLDIPGGASLAYLVSRARPTLGVAEIRVLVSEHMRFAWKGMEVRSHTPDFYTLVIEIDWRSDRVGRISVNRGEFELFDDAYRLYRSLLTEIRDFMKYWLRQNADSQFHLFNCHVAGFAVESARTPIWAFRDAVAARVLPIAAPATCKRYCPSTAAAFLWKNRPVTVLESVLKGIGDLIDFAGPGFAILPPDRIVALQRPRFAVVPFWSALDRMHAQNDAWPLPVCEFPPAWSRLCGVVFHNLEKVFGYVFNANHAVVRAADPIPIAEIDRLMKRKPRSRGQTASFLLRAIGAPGDWGFDGERDWQQSRVASFFAQLRGLMPEISPFYFWIQELAPKGSQLLILDEYGISQAEAASIAGFLPDPGPDWTLEISESNGAAPALY